MPELFIERNHEPLKEVFELLDMDPELTTDLSAAVAATQPWVKGDHVRPGHEISIQPPECGQMLHELYGQLGLKGEQPLPAGEYEQILVLGGMMLGMNRRLEFTNRMLKTAKSDNIILLGGERPVYPESESDLVVEAIAAAQRRDAYDPWIRHLNVDGSDVRWETDMMRLSATNQLGRLRLHAQDHYFGDPAGTPEVAVFGWRSKNIHLLHTRAVERPNGDRRHTTEACIAHWTQVLNPQPNARVGFVTANPHIERTGRVAQAALHAAGRPDITLEIGGSAAAPNGAHAIYLGEIARNLYEDQRSVG